MEKGKLLNHEGAWSYPKFSNKKQIGDLEKKIHFDKQKNNSTVFNFTSSRPKEGVSTIIANFIDYIVRKKAGEKILLIDLNFGNPVLHRLFNISLNSGIADCLAQGLAPSEVISSVSDQQIDILTCGKNHSELNGNISQDKLQNIIDAVKNDYEKIIIDSPPLLTSADSLPSAITSDLTFLVIQAQKTTSEVAQRALKILNENECALGGGVLNRVQRVIPEWMYKLL